MTRDGLSLVIVGLSSKGNESLLFHRLDSGSFQFSSRLKLHHDDGGGGGGPFHQIVPLPTHVPNRVALIDSDRGSVWDCRKKSLVKILSRWSGIHTRDGRLGLCAPNRGGLELVDLKTGAVVFTLIPRVAEGVFGVRTLFSANDSHVIYYHSGKRSIRVFRVADGRQIADYKTHAEITDIASAHDGRSLVLGAVDGSVIVLSLADSEMNDYVKFLTTMHDREPVSSRSRLTRRVSNSFFGIIWTNGTSGIRLK